MTAKQERFVAAYDGNATAAAIAAGYSPKTARCIGQENLTKPDIQEAIKEREAGRLGALIATREERQKFWTAVMGDEGQPMKERLRASELLGRSEGDFLERVEAKGEVITPASILAAIQRNRERAGMDEDKGW